MITISDCNNGLIRLDTYSYRLLAPINQKSVQQTKLSKKANISGHKSSMSHKVVKTCRSKMSIRLSSLFSFLGTLLVHCYHRCVTITCVQMHELPHSHFVDNWEGTLFSQFHISIMVILLLYHFSLL